MRRRLLLLGSLLALPSTAFATWSVIAVDRSTGRVVIASATCVDRDDQFLTGVQAVVVPGKGVAACQASVDGTHTNQMLVFNELQKGTDPKAIIELLSADPAFQSRQFGILDLQGRSAGHSGLTNGYVVAGHPGPGARHRDLLFDPGQHPAARRGRAERREGVPRHQGRDHRSRDGGDGSGRRVRRRQPLHVSAAGRPTARAPKIPCDGKTAHVAYILMAEKTDTNGDSHNNGKYAMYLTRRAARTSGPNAIHEGENLNPVKTLRMRYDEWRKTQPASFK